MDDEVVKCITQSEAIKYLGVDFTDEIVFDQSKVLKMLQSETLASTTMLKPGQKIKILNEYIWPKIIYPLQCAPLAKLTKSFIEKVNEIRSIVKEILTIPADTPNCMLYSPRNFKGLGIPNAEWEAQLQTINVHLLLLNTKNPYIIRNSDLNSEIESCLKKLNVVNEGEMLTTQKIRK